MAKNSGQEPTNNEADNVEEWDDIETSAAPDWWKPEAGEVLVVRIKAISKGQFGEYLVGVDAEDNEWNINLHPQLKVLKKYLRKIVRIEYLGQDDRVHEYALKKCPTKDFPSA